MDALSSLFLLYETGLLVSFFFINSFPLTSFIQHYKIDVYVYTYTFGPHLCITSAISAYSLLLLSFVLLSLLLLLMLLLSYFCLVFFPFSGYIHVCLSNFQRFHTKDFSVSSNIWLNTSLAAKGALAHRLQLRTDCKIQNGRQGAPKWQRGSGKVSTPRFLGVPVNFR